MYYCKKQIRKNKTKANPISGFMEVKHNELGVKMSFNDWAIISIRDNRMLGDMDSQEEKRHSYNVLFSKHCERKRERKKKEKRANIFLIV